MDIATIIGLILGFLAVGLGMVLKGASLAALINPAAIMIIIVGTIATVCIGFPLEDLKKIPKLFRVAFTQQKLSTKIELIKLFIEWAKTSRQEGILALETVVEEIEDDFLREGMQMVIDGNDSDLIREILEDNITAIEERHRDSALIFTQAGTYAPTLGVLGAVVGLIAALSNLNDIDELGHLISAAFVATLLGIFTGYVLWHPIANKLKQKSKVEIKLRKMMMEGILAIQSGISPVAVQQKLVIFLSAKEKMELKVEENSDE